MKDRLATSFKLTSRAVDAWASLASRLEIHSQVSVLEMLLRGTKSDPGILDDPAARQATVEYRRQYPVYVKSIRITATGMDALVKATKNSGLNQGQVVELLLVNAWEGFKTPAKAPGGVTATAPNKDPWARLEQYA